MTTRKDFEQEYFGREELASKHRHELEHQRQENIAAKEQAKHLHHMKCPKCGQDLRTVRMTQIDVDQCNACGAIVLAQSDIEKFVEEQSSIIKTLIDFFKP